MLRKRKHLLFKDNNENHILITSIKVDIFIANFTASRYILLGHNI